MHAFNPGCGCAQCCRAERSEERRDEYIAARVEEYADDPDSLRAAEEWTAGTFDGNHYTELTLALFAMHRTDPDKLPGSDVLTRLYRLARTEHDAMQQQLRLMAAEEWDKEDAA